MGQNPVPRARGRTAEKRGRKCGEAEDTRRGDDGKEQEMISRNISTARVRSVLEPSIPIWADNGRRPVPSSTLGEQCPPRSQLSRASDDPRSARQCHYSDGATTGSLNWMPFELVVAASWISDALQLLSQPQIPTGIKDEVNDTTKQQIAPRTSVQARPSP